MNDRPQQVALPKRRTWQFWPALLCAGLLLTGCSQDEVLETDYGSRTGSFARESVNGTAVLAEMFEDAGHDVSSWRVLSPRLDEADTIVWFPDRDEPPTPQVRQWLSDWLDRGRDRTLIYVGRDYDAAPFYWSQVLQGAPANLKKEIERRLQEARSEERRRRNEVPKFADADWFTIDGTAATRDVKSLSGPWSQSVDANKVDIVLNSRLEPADWADILLASQNDVIVSRLDWGGFQNNQIILIANGSFLLNLPLVNHEHRKLAGKLIDEVGPPGEVVFLETGPGAAEIREIDPSSDAPTGVELFTKWPLNIVLLHLGVVGLCFALARFPIFGLPCEPAEDPPNDFTKHVKAVGALLQKTKMESYARDRLAHYHQEVAPRR